MAAEEIHIGKLINDKLKEKGQTTSWLANKIHCERANIYKIFRKSAIDTDLLLKISLALEINFFAFYSDIYLKKIETENKELE